MDGATFEALLEWAGLTCVIGVLARWTFRTIWGFGDT